ncbi:MAG: hypothetical protein VKQ33_12070 [Candidatus Sericytochromatia bacterium]|nr:hypothetical protein [Candidatus Sericytochromatia bacterium]
MRTRFRALPAGLALSTAGSLTLFAAGCTTQPAAPVAEPPVVKARRTDGGRAAINARLRTGVRKPISYASPEDRVEVMTEAFSLSRNEGLQKASESFRALGSSFAGLQALTSPTGSTGSSRYHVVSSREGYALNGLTEYPKGDAVIVYDEETKEVTAVRSSDSELRLKFDRRGNTRSWSSEIVRSPDGTKGLLAVQVSAQDWVPYELPHQTRAPWVCTAPTPEPEASERPGASPSRQPSPSPIRTQEPSPPPSPARNLQQLDDASGATGPTPTPGPNDPPASRSTPGLTSEPPALSGTSPLPEPEDAGPVRRRCGPDPDWVAPGPFPFQVAGGEYPKAVEKLSLQLAITPRGDERLAMELLADLDEPINVLSTSIRLPGHWKLLARLPGMTLRWDSRLSLVPRNMSFSGSGKMIVEVGRGDEQFDFTVSLREASRTTNVSMTNVGAKLRLRIAGDQGEPLRSQVLSLESGREKEIGTVEWVPGSPNVALVRFDDGKTMRWELYPRNQFGQLGSGVGAFQPAPAQRSSPQQAGSTSP